MIRSPLRVVLVEDNPAEAALVRRLLRRTVEGEPSIEHFPRLQPGIDHLAANEPDIVLLDFSLPDSHGIETFRAAHRVAPHVPIIVLTNLDDDALASQAVGEGAQDYLVKKDITEGLLERSIRYAIERQRYETALSASRERFALAVKGANDGIWDWNLADGTAYFSDKWHEIVGEDTADDAEDDTIERWLARIHPSDLHATRAALDVHLEGRTPLFEHEHRIRHHDGHWVWVLARGCAMRDGDGRPQRMAGSFTDITTRKLAEERLIHDAFHDALTGLPNRHLFLDRLEQALQRSRRLNDPSMAVLFLDLDRFKNFNDSFGHADGDRLLVEFAGRLEDNLRPGDSLARLGGDEFGLLLTDLGGVEDATRVAERIHDTLRRPLSVSGHEIVTSASIGIALGPGPYTHPDDILRDADTAMYRAKAAGRGCSQIFDETMHSTVTALLRLEMDLRRAVEKEQFVMHYQPIVALRSGRTVGFEALVRWLDPERGLVCPERFIAVAEESGLIVPIGWWVLRESCHQMEIWQREFPSDPPLFMSVNVSGKLFSQPDIVERMWDILEETGLPAETLRLEITENILMDHGERALARMNDLRSLGIELSVDDFGTGYSSLSYLQRFAYDTLKIDRSFIAEMDNQPGREAIVKTIISLGKALGMNVVAEGVETPLQLQQLRAMECPHAQGFWFSRPLDSTGIQALLERSESW